MNIRNFCIIAHIDHGKSTLADRFLEMTHTVEKRKMREQFLDQMDLERERGITIKLQPVRMMYTPEGTDMPYVLNLIDTPGHADFAYEVSRSLLAVEGAVLLVDATQGIQAQTLANYMFAQQCGLTIIPALNKIDLAPQDLETRVMELAQLVGVEMDRVKLISGKTGEGVRNLLETIVAEIPPPTGNASRSSRALIFDSHFDNHKGVIANVRVLDGEFRAHERMVLFQNKKDADIMEVGYFNPTHETSVCLYTGEIGYIATGIKDPGVVRVGDTIVVRRDVDAGRVEPFPGYEEPRPMVFVSCYPSSADDYPHLARSLSKLKLNDAALFYEPEQSLIFGRGFRAGFLGLLHLDVAIERMKREYNIEMMVTTPSVSYQVAGKDGIVRLIYRASDYDMNEQALEIREPWVRLEILAPQRYYGNVLQLVENYRLQLMGVEGFGDGQVIHFEAPLAEIIVNFYDNLKSVSQGYASMSYTFLEYRKGDLERLDILIAGERFDGFSRILPKSKIEREGRAVAAKLKDLLPRENFAVAIQAAVGSRIVARETIPALRKDVTGYLYGGDRSRKMKLWKKQKEGKKRLKELGKVTVEPHIFYEVFK
ncbi:MAG: translation elongation factor 4 [Patescibacteria group bacterium]|nr:translation elongation factor 4 [Patescibacteria group bacterium]MDE2438296.1 translation elongation factor 4 [Patescibacteria group bacterium]